MQFLEKNLEDIVMSLNSEQCVKVGLAFLSKGNRKRQVKIGSYGVCDVLHVERLYNDFYDPDPDEYRSSLCFTIIELKKDKTSMSAYIQISRYMAGLNSYLEKRLPNIPFIVKGVVIGSGFDLHEDFCYVSSLEGGNIRFYKYNYNWDGISFESQRGFTLINEGFNLKDN